MFNTTTLEPTGTHRKGAAGKGTPLLNPSTARLCFLLVCRSFSGMEDEKGEPGREEKGEEK